MVGPTWSSVSCNAICSLKNDYSENITHLTTVLTPLTTAEILKWNNVTLKAMVISCKIVYLQTDSTSIKLLIH